MSESRPVAYAELRLKAVDNEVLVHDPKTRRVHILNATAAFVLSLCDNTRGMEAIAQEFAVGTAIPLAEARMHVRVVIDEFLREHIVSMQQRG